MCWLISSKALSSTNCRIDCHTFRICQGYWMPTASLSSQILSHSLNILEHFSISIPTTNLNSGIVPVKLSEIFIQRFLTKISRKQCNMLRPTIPLELLSFDKSYWKIKFLILSLTCITLDMAFAFSLLPPWHRRREKKIFCSLRKTLTLPTR